MATRKVELKYITNVSARKTTYKKRERGLIKKIGELSILCDVPVCLIMYSPYDNNPVVWPNPLAARNIIQEYRNMSESEQTKRMFNQETFLKERVAKLTEKLRKLKRENDEKELSRDMFQCLVGRPLRGLSGVTLSDMRAYLEQYTRNIAVKLNRMKEGCSTWKPASAPISSGPAFLPPVPMVTGGELNMNVQVQEAQWYDMNLSNPQFGSHNNPFD